MFFYNNSDANRDGGRWSRPAQEEGDEDYVSHFPTVAKKINMVENCQNLSNYQMRRLSAPRLHFTRHWFARVLIFLYYFFAVPSSVYLFRMGWVGAGVAPSPMRK